MKEEERQGSEERKLAFPQDGRKKGTKEERGKRMELSRDPGREQASTTTQNADTLIDKTT